jgi:hypothetical protein
MAVPMKSETRGEVMEAVIVKGDIGKLSPEERAHYYTQVCNSMGLNPLTQPLEYVVLNGKMRLYAKKDATDQLRKINQVSLEIVSQDISDGMLSVHVRARTPDGRTDEDLGVVALGEHLKGEARANQILKAITKAKRRVTLSISGLGFLDETEVEDIPSAAKRPVAKPSLIRPIETHDPDTGEITVEDVKQLPPQLTAPATAEETKPAPQPPGSGAGKVPSAEDYVEHWSVLIEESTDPKQLADAWNAGKKTRNLINWDSDDQYTALRDRVSIAIAKLKG